MSRIRAIAPVASALLFLSACGTDLPDASEVTTVRVLGVRTDHPIAAPGATSELQMLYVDGRARALGPRPVSVFWMAGCTNPVGDLYSECYPALHEIASQVPDEVLESQTLPPSTPAGSVGFGPAFTAVVPPDVIDVHPQPPATVHPYGVLYVWSAVCAGHLRHDVQATANDFPLGCYSETGERLGTDDFVTGYFPLYVYRDITNENPVVRGLTFQGAAASDPCAVDSDCPSAQACSTQGVCVPVVPLCAQTDIKDCPKYALKPDVDPSSVERALSAQVPDDRAPSELIWISYYTDFGDFASSARIVHDPYLGDMGEYEGQWRAPATAGEARLWAIVHDSRLGTTWVEQRVAVR